MLRPAYEANNPAVTGALPPAYGDAVIPGALPTAYGGTSPANLFRTTNSGFYGDTALLRNNFTTSAGSTNATAAGDPLGRIVRIAGSLNLTQSTDANRPALGTAANFYLPLMDGSNDFFTTGAQSFGTASLFATAAQTWTTWGVFKTSTAANQTLIAKAGATVGDRTLHVLVDSGGLFAAYVRGQFNQIATSVANGAFHVWCLRWDGSACKAWLDRASAATFTVGSAAEESETIFVGARTAASPAVFFNGHNLSAMIDRSLSDFEVAQLMAYLNNTFRAGL